MHPIRRMPLLCLLAVALILASCARNSAPPTAVPLPPAAPVPLTDADLNADTARAYRTQVDYTPNDATYFDLINGKLPLADAELTLLEQQGFVLSERWTWQR